MTDINIVNILKDILRKNENMIDGEYLKLIYNKFDLIFNKCNELHKNNNNSLDAFKYIEDLYKYSVEHSIGYYLKRYLKQCNEHNKLYCNLRINYPVKNCYDNYLINIKDDTENEQENERETQIKEKLNEIHTEILRLELVKEYVEFLKSDKEILTFIEPHLKYQFSKYKEIENLFLIEIPNFPIDKFNEFTYNFFNDKETIRLEKELFNWNNVIISGGSLSKIYNSSLNPDFNKTDLYLSSDIDIYFYGNMNDKRDKLHYVINYLKLYYGEDKCTLINRRNIIEILVNGIKRKFQLICGGFKTKYEIIKSFDMSHCKALYDGYKFWCLDSFIYTMETKEIICTLIPNEIRVFKAIKQGLNFKNNQKVTLYNTEFKKELDIYLKTRDNINNSLNTLIQEKNKLIPKCNYNLQHNSSLNFYNIDNDNNDNNKEIKEIQKYKEIINSLENLVKIKNDIKKKENEKKNNKYPLKINIANIDNKIIDYIKNNSSNIEKIKQYYYPEINHTKEDIIKECMINDMIINEKCIDDYNFIIDWDFNFNETKWYRSLFYNEIDINKENKNNTIKDKDQKREIDKSIIRFRNSVNLTFNNNLFKNNNVEIDWNTDNNLNKKNVINYQQTSCIKIGDKIYNAEITLHNVYKPIGNINMNELNELENGRSEIFLILNNENGQDGINNVMTLYNLSSDPYLNRKNIHSQLYNNKNTYNFNFINIASKKNYKITEVEKVLKKIKTSDINTFVSNIIMENNELKQKLNNTIHYSVNKLKTFMNKFKNSNMYLILNNIEKYVYYTFNDITDITNALLLVKDNYDSAIKKYGPLEMWKFSNIIMEKYINIYIIYKDIINCFYTNDFIHSIQNDLKKSDKYYEPTTNNSILCMKYKPYYETDNNSITKSLISLSINIKKTEAQQLKIYNSNNKDITKLNPIISSCDKFDIKCKIKFYYIKNKVSFRLVPVSIKLLTQ